MKARMVAALRAAAIGALTIAVCAALHEGLARSLAGMGLLEQLLSPTTDALIALLAALTLYALRLLLFVALPAFAAASVVRAWLSPPSSDSTARADSDHGTGVAKSASAPRPRNAPTSASPS